MGQGRTTTRQDNKQQSTIRKPKTIASNHNTTQLKPQDKTTATTRDDYHKTTQDNILTKKRHKTRQHTAGVETDTQIIS